MIQSWWSTNHSINHNIPNSQMNFVCFNVALNELSDLSKSYIDYKIQVRPLQNILLIVGNWTAVWILAYQGTWYPWDRLGVQWQSTNKESYITWPVEYDSIMHLHYDNIQTFSHLVEIREYGRYLTQSHVKHPKR